MVNKTAKFGDHGVVPRYITLKPWRVRDGKTTTFAIVARTGMTISGMGGQNVRYSEVILPTMSVNLE